jgi:hypothetical protein
MKLIHIALASIAAAAQIAVDTSSQSNPAAVGATLNSSTVTNCKTTHHYTTSIVEGFADRTLFVDQAQPQLEVRHPQHPGVITSWLLGALSLFVASKARSYSLVSIATTSVAAYLFCDMFLNMLHMFLDHEKNMTHALYPIRNLADNFQQHHEGTQDTFRGNHMLDIDLLVSSVLGFIFMWHTVFWAYGRQLPRSLALWALLVCTFGELAIFNHSCCHARTHGVAIPQWVVVFQDWGLLIKNSFHKVHHTTYEEHFAFLVGFSPVYDHIYHTFNLKAHYEQLHMLFWMFNPHCVLSCVAIGSLLFPSKAKDAVISEAPVTKMCTCTVAEKAQKVK